MTNELTASLTHDAAMVTVMKNIEANLDTLLMVNGALSCLSNIALNATEDDQIVVSDLGCLIWLCDRQTNQMTNNMLLQLDQMRAQMAKK